MEEKMLYHVSGAPFIRAKTDTQRIMLDVLIALRNKTVESYNELIKMSV